MKKLKISDMALQQLCQLEGLRLTAYRDIAGVLTIGYGHTTACGEPIVLKDMEITSEQAMAILHNDLKQYENLIQQKVIVPLNSAQYDALILFAYNIGINNFTKSSLLRKLNQGNYAEVPLELMKWVYIDGKICAGLVKRRTIEANLWHFGEAKTKNIGQTGHNLANVNISYNNYLTTIKHIVAILTPLTGLGSAFAQLLEHAPILQVSLSLLMLPGMALALYYYHRYNQHILP